MCQGTATGEVAVPMLLLANRLLGLQVVCPDRAIGPLTDLYFDPHRWAVRYLVIQDPPVLPGRQVILATADLLAPNGNAPLLRTAMPFERIAAQRSLLTRADPAATQDGEGRSGPDADSSGTPLGSVPHLEEVPAPRRAGSAHWLHAASELIGWELRCYDGPLGRLAGLVTDSHSWQVRYLAAELRDPPQPGCLALVPTFRVYGFQPGERVFHVDLPGEQVRTSPPWRPQWSVSTEQEQAVAEHYRSEHP